MKVCIISKRPVFEPRIFYKEGKSLRGAGYEVSILGWHHTSEIYDGIKLIGFTPPNLRVVRFSVTNYHIFRSALREKAEVYHFHDLDFIPWALLLKLMTGRVIIYDIREAHPEYIRIKSYIPRMLRNSFSKLVYLMEQFSIKFFNAILPNDNYIAQGFNHQNNVVIFNFPILDFFKDMKIKPYQDRKFDLFYHGTLPTYHFKTMLAISEKLNREKIPNRWGIVAGPTSPLVWAQQQVRDRRLDDNFTFLPYVDYMKVIEYLAEVKIGIIPLPPYEKFMKNIPLKMFEFMGCGLPIVLSDLPPSRQFISGKNCAIAVEPDNIDEYAKAIMFLLSNPDSATQMGNNGKRLVFERYNWEVEEKKLVGLYRNILKS